MKGQSAIEFISVYGFMLIVAALFIALIVLFAFAAQNSIKTSQCGSFGGFYCVSAQVISNVVTRNSIVFFALDTQQSIPINVTGVNVIIGNGTYSGTCTPRVSTPGYFMNCTAYTNFVRIGQQVIGSYTLNGRYCNSPLNNVLSGACAYQNVIYSGSFSTYASSRLSLGYQYVQLVPAEVVGAVSGAFDFPQAVSVAPDGSYAYVTDGFGGPSGFLGSMSVVNTSTNTVTGSINSSMSFPKGVSIAPSGKYAYVYNQNVFSYPPYIEAIDTAGGSGLYALSLYNSTPPGSVTISPSGAYAYISGQLYGFLSVDTATNQISSVNIPQLFIGSQAAAFSPNGNYAYMLGMSNVIVLNTAGYAVVNSISSPLLSSMLSMGITPDGKYLYVTTSNNNIEIVDIATGTVVSSITSGLNYPTGIAFMPNGAVAYVVNQGSGNVVIVNTGSYN